MNAIANVCPDISKATMTSTKSPLSTYSLAGPTCRTAHGIIQPHSLVRQNPHFSSMAEFSSLYRFASPVNKTGKMSTREEKKNKKKQIRSYDVASHKHRKIVTCGLLWNLSSSKKRPKSWWRVSFFEFTCCFEPGLLRKCGYTRSPLF